jgi:ComEC/Rec2-related protein
LKQDFQASGLFHILAVSGQNVVLVAAGALVLAWLLGVSRWVGEIGALASIGAYVLAVGPQASVIRAGIAGALASLAWLTGRLRDAWQALLLGGVALLAWNPYEVYDPDFQLYFAAVVADDPDLDLQPFRTSCHDGDDSIVGKDSVFDLFARLLYRLSEGKLDRLEVGLK